MRATLISISCLGIAMMSAGCVVHTYVEPAPPPPPVQAEVVTGPGIEVVEVEPAPVERVYVYDEGYPPGCYFWGGFVYWGGRRYERDVFVTRVVNINIRERRYVNVTENRRISENVQIQHRQVYERTGGHVTQRTTNTNTTYQHQPATPTYQQQHQPGTPQPPPHYTGSGNPPQGQQNKPKPHEEERHQ